MTDDEGKATAFEINGINRTAFDKEGQRFIVQFSSGAGNTELLAMTREVISEITQVLSRLAIANPPEQDNGERNIHVTHVRRTGLLPAPGANALIVAIEDAAGSTAYFELSDDQASSLRKQIRSGQDQLRRSGPRAH